MEFIALDFETANRSRTSACSIGVIYVKNAKVIDEFYTLIDPEQEFEGMNIAVHGIRPADVVGAPTFYDVWQELLPTFEGKPLIAHNASFDMSVLRGSLDQHGLLYPELDYGCSYLMAKKQWPALENHKLSTVASMLSVPLRHHHALDDARASAEIALAVAAQTESPTFATLHETLDIKPGRLYPGGYTAASAKGIRRKRQPRRNWF